MVIILQLPCFLILNQKHLERMNTLVSLIFILVSIFASVIGSICGIGGGVFIKPVLDLFGLYSISTISFMSSCIVFAMTAYSVVKANLSHDSRIEKGSSTCLGIGAALGGLLGKHLFDIVKGSFADPNTVGAVQAVGLFLVTMGTTLYTINKSRIRTLKIHSSTICIAIGICLGIMSSFLGIGGGPIDVVVFYFFFSMDTKTAAQNSLYTIFFSQFASIASTVVLKNVPDIPVKLLICMICGSIAGAIVGRRINQKIEEKTIRKLFVSLMVIIMLICCFNFFQYFD